MDIGFPEALLLIGLLLGIGSTDANRSLVFDVASFTVLASIIAHGLTDTLGANWLERRLASVGTEEDDVGERVQSE